VKSLHAPPTQPGGASRETHAARLREARSLAGMARERMSNTWFRLAACAIVAFASLAMIEGITPLVWLAGLTPLLAVEYTLFRRLALACEGREALDGAPKISGLIVWTFIVSAYSNALAVMLWYSGYLHGPMLAAIFIIAGFGNAAATLRGSGALALAGIIPSAAAFLGLPLIDYALGGAANPFDLLPLIGAILFLGFGANLWTTLRASDAAQERAEAAAERERQAAKAAALAKTSAITRMNDELRTPMAALMGAAEHLRRAAMSPEARVHIGALVEAGDVLRTVLSDLSDLDRLENGVIKVETKPVDPREIARGAIAAFRAPAHDKGLELFLDIAPEAPSLVEIDPVRLRQLLFNLLANAVRYTSHGGVRLRLQTQPGLDAAHVRLGFSVSDTGKGMSRSQLALIFQQGAVAGPSDGAGLGLLISLRLARLMGGRLGAKSELGHGTTVSFVAEVPLSAVAPQEHGALSAA
jgi:signal transduction histidine kinase